MQQLVDPEFIQRAEQRFDEEIAYAIKAGEHYWQAVQIHRITPAALDGADLGPLLNDRESLRMMRVGCFICETEWEPRLTRRRCPRPRLPGPRHGPPPRPRRLRSSTHQPAGSHRMTDTTAKIRSKGCETRRYAAESANTMRRLRERGRQ